jgi:hypothetical protein
MILGHLLRLTRMAGIYMPSFYVPGGAATTSHYLYINQITIHLIIII